MSVSIQIKGLDKLIKNFRGSSLLLKKEIGKAVRDSEEMLQRTAKKEVPIQTTNLQKSIFILSRSNPFSGGITAKAKYASHVEYGTRPHIIKARTAKVLANKKTGQVFGRTVRHPGTKANPFMHRSADKEKGGIIKKFELALNNIAKGLTK